MKRTEEQYNEYITIIIEKSTGRADITLKEPAGNVYYYAEKQGNKWLLKFCENGFCYNATLVDTFKTLKECIEIIRDVCKDLTDHYRAIEDAEANYRKYKGYHITGNENTGFVALAPYGYYSGKVYETEEEAIADIEKDIAESVPIEDTESFEVPVEDDEPAEVIEKAHEILSNPLTVLDVRTSVLKSAFNRNYGKQVIDAEMNMKKTELTGFHVSCIITETGMTIKSCDIYAQDLDKEESYLAYLVGKESYAIYDEKKLEYVGHLYDETSVLSFFVSRLYELEAETIKTLY